MLECRERCNFGNAGLFWLIPVRNYRLGEKEALIIRFGRELFGDRKVSSETFAGVVQTFGKQAVVDLSAVMGYYSFIATTINAFDLQLSPDQKAVLPLP